MLAQLSPDLMSRRRRLLILLIAFGLIGLAISLRLFFWQVVQHDRLGELATMEHEQRVPIAPRRGVIRDSRGYVLATNVAANVVYAAPHEIKDVAKTATRLSPLLNKPYDTLVQSLSRPDRFYVSLARRVPWQKGEEIEKLKETEGLPGVYLEPESRRIYPADTFAAHIIGFANYDNQGFYGVEGYYDEAIRGEPGFIIQETDVVRRENPLGSRSYSPPIDGADVYLTLDRAIQAFVELKLEETIRVQRAAGGVIIVVEPKTGKILAMASRPVFNPNTFDAPTTDKSTFINQAISSGFELGSVFKIVTMAAALDAGVITPQSTFNDPGYILVSGVTLHNYNRAGHGPINPTQILEYSSNVGMVQVAQRLGKDRFYRYIKAFGFGEKLGIDLAGEAAGVLPDPNAKTWQELTLANNSFGQGLTMTPLQMTMAAAAIANGGVLLKPYVVDRVVGGATTQVNRPTAIRQVIRPEVSRTMSEMLTTAVNQYGKVAAIPGYKVAGKTGTAQWPNPQTKTYDPHLTVTSFVGYAPANDPQFLILVTIDRPQGSIWAQEVAAPLFQEIASWLLLYLRLPPGR